MSQQTLQESVFAARRLAGAAAMGVRPSRRNCQVAAVRLTRDTEGDAALRARVTPAIEMFTELVAVNAVLPEESRASSVRDQCHVLCEEVRMALRSAQTESQRQVEEVDDDESPAPGR